MMKSILFLVCVAFSSVYCVAGCDGTVNTHPFVPSAPQLLTTSPNGKLFAVKGITPNVYVAHVYGTSYEMGFAQGKLMKKEILDTFGNFYAYAEALVETAILPYVPKFLRADVAELGLKAVTELQYLLMEKYIPQHFKDEMQGMADAIGLSYRDVAGFNMVPSVVKAHCTMVGAWDTATTANNTMLQLRALDWAVNTPLQKQPLVLFYHPTLAGSVKSFSIVTWPGLIGALTGMNSAPLGICEKVWLHYKGTDHREGIPFPFVLRDILQFDTNSASAINRLVNAKRTCSIFAGVGDPNQVFNILEYSVDKVDIFNDMNFEVNNTAHPQIKDVVYVDKHAQPSGDPCLGNVLKGAVGSITADVLIRQAGALLQTGDTHSALYDYKSMRMYVSNASPWVNGTSTPAYDRPFVDFDMNLEFSRAR